MKVEEHGKRPAGWRFFGLGGTGDLQRGRRWAVLWMLGLITAAAVAGWMKWPFRGEQELLVVAYDGSREYLAAIGGKSWNGAASGAMRIHALHAGSIQQTENLARGLIADVVLLASRWELENRLRGVCVGDDWREQFAYGGSPFTSTVVLLVKHGNPHGLADWEDLAETGLRVAMPDPRASGIGRYGYLTLVADALRRYEDDPVATHQWVAERMRTLQLVRHGAYTVSGMLLRDAAWDVLITWESEALRICRLNGGGTGAATDGYEIVYPRFSLLAEPVVAVLQCHAQRRDTLDAALALIGYMYSACGQATAAAYGLRPREPVTGVHQLAGRVPQELATVEALFGSWASAWAQHLGPGSSFERILEQKRARSGGVE